MNSPDKPSVSLSLSHIKGIDSIRFICALWVLFGHLGGFPLVVDADLHSFIGKAAKGLYGLFYNGPAAVIIFFIVSGFCIHLPYRDLKRVPISVFYARRYIRIGVPVAIAMLLASWLGVKALIIQPTSLVILPHSVQMVEDSDIGVIWSLVCELIYYSLYPLLFIVIRRWGWKMTLGLAYGLAAGVVLIRPDAHSYAAYGNLLTWIVGLPCWLLGCYLADTFRYSEHEKISLTKIWLWRLAIWTISALILALRFHTPIGFPWSLNFFAVLVFLWLQAEIMFYSRNNPLPLLEWGGKWSYSIYLGHVLAQPFFIRIGFVLNLGAAGPILNWFGEILVVLIFCWLFYVIVEFPSHRLARLVSRKLSQPIII